MATFYFDANAVSGSGTLDSPYPWSFATLSGLAIGSDVYFRGASSRSTPRQYSGGGTLTQKNFTYHMLPGEHVQFLDPAARFVQKWNRWTAGGISIPSTSSMRFGPGQTSDPTANTSWGSSDGANPYAGLWLEGCDGGSAATPILLDGNSDLTVPSGTISGLPIASISECGLIFNDASDLGLWITADSTNLVGSRYIKVRFAEGTNNGAAIHIHSPSDASRNPKSWHTGDGIIIEYSVLHDNTRMLSNTGSGDVGAQGIGLSRPWGTSSDPLVIRYCHIYGNHSDSVQYGEDGIGIEWYGCGHHRYYGNVIHDCAGFMESGTDSTSPLSSDLVIYRNVMYGKSNGFGDTNYHATPGSSGSPGVLLRDFSDSYFINNTIDLGPNGTLAHALMFFLGGSFPGLYLRAVVENNTIVERDAKVPLYLKDMPSGADAVTVNFDDVWRTDGDLHVADTGTTSPGVTNTLTFAQLQAAGYEGSGKNVNPTWVDRTSQDYRLQSTSALINAGTQISPYTDGFSGTAPDIGAIEFVSTPALAGVALGSGTSYQPASQSPRLPHLTLTF